LEIEMDDPNMHAYGDHYPDDSEVPGAHPPPDHPLSRLAARLGELLDEDQWAECERLLLDGWAHDVIDRKTGQHWRENSALEVWFPFTAEELERLRTENAELRHNVEVTGDARLYRAASVLTAGLCPGDDKGE
jgi:hypothetical protein